MIMNTNNLTRYLIRFLLGEAVEEDIVDRVGYTDDEEEFWKYKVVIKPSRFFDEKTYGTEDSMPILPLQALKSTPLSFAETQLSVESMPLSIAGTLLSCESTPLLFGRPEITRLGDTLVVYADIIASSYFLLSRYEEYLRRDVRDEHGRFKGKESLPCRAGFIHRPVVDEYGCLLREWLRSCGIEVEEPPSRIDKIYLTHDVDAPFAYRTWRNIARGLKERQNLFKLLKIKFGDLNKDPYYTFPEIFEYDDFNFERDNRRFKPDNINFNKDSSHFDNDNLNFKFDNRHIQALLLELSLLPAQETPVIPEKLLFFKVGGHTIQDRPQYNLRGRDMRQLFSLMKEHGYKAGLHSSYAAGMNPSLISAEKARLEDALGLPITANRHHFLAAREPEDMETLADVGFTDDFTMGYADVAGFRLGTARAVKYINPVTLKLSDTLTLHPLNIMDSTLNSAKYMNLTASAAEEYCRNLIIEVSNNYGSLTLLWHNTSFAEDSYLRDLYIKLIKEIE
jgi:hypothetical protein